MKARDRSPAALGPGHKIRKRSAATLVAAFLLAGPWSCVCTRSPKTPAPGTEKQPPDQLLNLMSDFKVDSKTLTSDLETMTQAPHPLGSPRQKEIVAWLEKRIQNSGGRAIRQDFTAQVPNPDLLENPQLPLPQTLTKMGTNLYALDLVQADAPCVIALATHFDTKDLSRKFPSSVLGGPLSPGQGVDYLGANDSASSTVGLLAQIDFLRRSQDRSFGLKCEIIGIFFDGEEAVLPDWTDGISIHPARIVDNTYGSRFAASVLTECKYNDQKAKCLPPELGGKPLLALILMDMIGCPDLVISRDVSSSKKLWAILEEAASALRQSARLSQRPQMIEDDHIPFLRTGVHAIDIIDFEHLTTWHQESDNMANISHQSIDLGAKLGLLSALLAGQKPQVF